MGFRLGDRYGNALTFAREEDLYPRIPVILNTAISTRITTEMGQYDTFFSNNYLDLSSHALIKQVLIDYLNVPTNPIGACQSQALGTMEIFKTVGKQLGTFVGMEDALIFSSAYLASVGCIGALADPFPYYQKEFLAAYPDMGTESVIICDELNHKSLFHAARSARSRTLVFRHNDMAHLEELLRKHAATHGLLVVVDGVYSMDGEIAPLSEISRLTHQYGGLLFVDDSHGFGVLGKDGRGTPDLLGVKPDLYLASFTKACGSAGGFIAGRSDVIEYLRLVAGPAIFSDPIFPALVASFPTVLDIFASSDGATRRARILSMADGLRTRLRSAGLTVLGEGTPIVPLLLGDTRMTKKFADLLCADYSIAATPITRPAVPAHKSRLRFCMTFGHSVEQVLTLGFGCEKVGKILKII